MALPDPWKLNNDKPFELDKDARGWSYPTANQGGNKGGSSKPPWGNIGGSGGSKPPMPNWMNQSSKKQNSPNYGMGRPNPDVPGPPQFQTTDQRVNQQVDQFDRNIKTPVPDYEYFDPKGRTKNPQGPDSDEYRYYGQDWERYAPPVGSQQNNQNTRYGNRAPIDKNTPGYTGDGWNMGRVNPELLKDDYQATGVDYQGAREWERQQQNQGQAQNQNFTNNTGANAIPDRGRGRNWRDAATRADHRLQHSERNGKYSTMLSELRGPTIQAEESFNSDIDQLGQVDNSFDNTFGNNNSFGPGSAVGNNNSVTIISQGGQGLNNLQSVAAYKALNNNEYEKSYQRMNGYGRTAGAIEQTEGQLGIVDRVSNIYNMAGLSQAYWNDKSMAHQADYLGDIWKEGGFEYQMPGHAARLEDKTDEIAEDIDFGKKD